MDDHVLKSTLFSAWMMVQQNFLLVHILALDALMLSC